MPFKTPLLSEATVNKRARTDDPVRTRLTRVLGDLYEKYAKNAPSVARVLAEEGSPLYDTDSFRAMLFNKRTATLEKRANSLRLYAKWFETTGLEIEAFFLEPIVSATSKGSTTTKPRRRGLQPPGKP